MNELSKSREMPRSAAWDAKIMGDADLGKRPEAEDWMHQHLKLSVKEQILSGQLDKGVWILGEFRTGKYKFEGSQETDLMRLSGNEWRKKNAMQGLSPGTPALRNGGGVKEIAKEPEKEWSVK